MYHIFFYVPKEHCEETKEAMFAAGAGKIGNYEACAWQVAGQGQFRPMQGSDPFLGDIGRLETVEEYRVEMVCEADKIEDVIQALKEAHPYEEVAYGVVITAPTYNLKT